MKTMTCEQLGSACDLALHGTTADDVIKAQDAHLKEVVAGGDESHRDALKAMKGRWRPDLRYRLVQGDQADLRRPARRLTG